MSAMVLFWISLAWDAPTATIDDSIRINIEKRIAYGQFPSIAIGIVTAEGTSTWAAGSIPQGKPDEKTIDEIGSISKTFTALLLALEIEAGRINLTALILHQNGTHKGPGIE
ncbi:MAG: serine hydrolase [Acidobacteria bacterium]|nr:serine hydrolase [Acidobacteriota bacterium]